MKFRLRFSFLKRMKLSRMKMRTKAIIAVVLAFVLLASGVLAILVQTGKLGTRADTSIKTVKFSGVAKDPSNGKVISGAQISLVTGAGILKQTTTSSMGTYSVSASINTSLPENQYAKVKFNKEGYYDGREFSRDYDISTTTSTSVTITKNFRNGVKPPDYGPECTGAGLTRKEVGVTKVVFCAMGTAYTIFDQYPDQINKMADQIAYLRTQTGFPNLVRYILLQEQITWTNVDDPPSGTTAFGGAVANPEYGRFVFPRSRFYHSIDENLDFVTHETGHLVDYLKGKDITDSNGQKDRNEFSWETSLYWARNIAVKSKAAQGYWTYDYDEFYAEIFDALFAKNSNGIFIYREKLFYLATNFLLDKDSYILVDYPYIAPTSPAPKNEDLPKSWFDNHPSSQESTIKMGTGTIGQDALIYAIKAVAESNHLQNPFSGTVQLDGTQWRTVSYTDIYFGKYMSTGLVPIVLKECNLSEYCTDPTDVTIGDVIKNTRIWHSSDVFSDKSGDLFDLTGTVVMMVVPAGTQTISVSGFQSGAIKPTSVPIIPGANPIVFIDANGNLGFNYSNQFGSYGTGNGQFVSIEDIAVDPANGNIFAIDKIGWGPGQSRVEVFDRTGKYLSQFGQSNLSDASRIALNKNGDVFVLTNSNGVAKVIVFKNNGTYSTSIGLSYGARDIATDPTTGELYVLIGSGKSVYVYTSSYSYFRAFSLSGVAGIGGIYTVDHIALNSSHDIYGTDSKNKVVRRFDTFGQYWGEQFGTFQNIADLAIDSSNRIYVLDSTTKKIQVFDKDRNYLTQFASSDQEAIPMDLAVGSDGKVSVGYSNLQNSSTP